MPKCSRGREEAGGIFKRHQVGAYRGNRENLVGDASLTHHSQSNRERPKRCSYETIGG
ncbi:hypothetical protein ES319_1Z037300v1 [Gossypium barbadense]|uniref:Uncharacterized protein n=1 Tax=Gossypium barbadense TaxID=3634 RepID=A0A5J5NC16_GOSBA|nr:hypothetical protein ES319_1Z037300v1 [Gossypium barbadense]